MKPILKTLSGKKAKKTPLWFMRQAGRYLPEYQALRKEEEDFLLFCLSPKLAAEATLQPLRRFDLDAAILFSDILVIPHLLGQKLHFENGVGPRLEPIVNGGDLAKLSLDQSAILEPVYETLDRVLGALDSETAMIGFAGAPWTVASFMIAGKSDSECAAAKRFAALYPKDFASLLKLILAATERHLLRQAEAGAEILQIFDSFAGALSKEALRRFSLGPILSVAQTVKRRFPSLPIIAFPKGAGALYAEYLRSPFIDAVSLDETLSPLWAAEKVQILGCVQGNLHPETLLVGGAEMENDARRLVKIFGQRPYIFSLGHGILPKTPPDHLQRLIECVRAAE